MKETAICSLFVPCEAKRETFQLAVKPSAEISCFAGRKRPWKQGCGQSARIDTLVSAPSGTSASASEPPSSSVKENWSGSAFARERPSSGACNPAAVATSPGPGVELGGKTYAFAPG